MKILFTGGGTGGHFYPIIAMVQEIGVLISERKLVTPKYYYMSDQRYDEKSLFEYDIKFVKVTAGKMRRYFSIYNISDIFKTVLGVFVAVWKMFIIYPDVVVGKGGYASFPALVAAKILRIPVIIHDSDAIPGRANIFGGKFAIKIGIAYEDAAKYFPKDRTAIVGVPIRQELLRQVHESEGARAYLRLEDNIPVIMVVGGSQGAQSINDCVLDILPELVNKYQIIHQVGNANIKDILERVTVPLSGDLHKERYKAFGFLGSSALAMVAGVSSLVITRAGSTFLFEIAAWGLPSIVIPIPESVSHDQHRNAFNYARTGSAVLLEEDNLKPHILLAEIERLMDNPDLLREMREHARAFARPHAGRKMAEVILNLVLTHEH